MLDQQNSWTTVETVDHYLQELTILRKLVSIVTSKSKPMSISLAIAAALTIFLAVIFVPNISSTPDQVERSTAPDRTDDKERFGTEGTDIAAATKAHRQVGARPEAKHHIEEFSDMSFDPIAELRLLGINTSVDSLMAIVADEGASSDARFWSAIALGQTRAPGSSQLLADILGSDANINVRLGAISGLAYLGEPGSIDVLKTHIRDDPSESIRLAVVSAIYKSKSEVAYEIISEAAVNQLQILPVRAHAIEVLAQDLSESSANTMRVLLVDDHVELRTRAALALSKNNSEEAMPTLVSSALDEDLPLETWDQVRRQLQKISGEDFAAVKPHEYTFNPAARMTTNLEIEVWWKNVTGTN